MECINLTHGRHQLCTKEDNQPVYDSQGSLLVFDTTNGNLMSVPVSKESLAFFNVQQIIPDSNELECLSPEPSNASTSTQSSIQHASWKDDNATRRLIYAWKEHENDFKGGKYKSSQVWANIALVLQNENSQWFYTGTQCENKFKELRKKYVKVKDHNKQSGNSPRTCKFFTEFEEMLGDKPCVQPVAVASNLKKRLLTPSSQDTETEDGSGKEEYSRNKKIKKTKVQKELSEWSTALREDARYREEAREQRHKELIAVSNRAVATYKEMMEKLIDKL